MMGGYHAPRVTITLPLSSLTRSDVDEFRQRLAALPEGLAAAIYVDLYNAGHRIATASAQAEKYRKELPA